MEESTPPVFEDVVRLDDPWVQNHLAHAPDAVIAAAIDGAPAAVCGKLLANLSTRRREAVRKLRGSYPPRTREVSRRVLVSILWELPDPEAQEELRRVAPEQKKIDYVRLMKWLAEKNPAVREAQERRRQAIQAGILRRLLGLGGEPDA